MKRIGEPISDTFPVSGLRNPKLLPAFSSQNKRRSSQMRCGALRLAVVRRRNRNGSDCQIPPNANAMADLPQADFCVAPGPRWRERSFRATVRRVERGEAETRAAFPLERLGVLLCRVGDGG